jgi:hypothetical protein
VVRKAAIDIMRKAANNVNIMRRTAPKAVAALLTFSVVAIAIVAGLASMRPGPAPTMSHDSQRTWTKLAGPTTQPPPDDTHWG